MSKVHLNVGHVPKGTVKSSIDRLILKYIQEHPGCRANQVSEFIRTQRQHHLNGGLAEVPGDAQQRLQWLRNRVAQLVKSMHVVTRLEPGESEANERRYYPLKVDGVFQGVDNAWQEDSTVAQPGRYDVMRCPAYKPPRPNVRPGGMDFARYPSLHNGSRQPFVPGR